MKTDLIIKFDGEETTDHKLPAYAGSQSLYGISRSLQMITNYLSEGRVRYRRFENSDYEVNIVATRDGSFEILFEIVTSPEAWQIASGVVGGAASQLFYDVIKSTFRRSVGKSATERLETLEERQLVDAGDMAALVEAIEPAVREAHQIINNGASNIIIVNGDNNIVKFNGRTKSYVSDSIVSQTILAKLFSVASFNVNSGYGRAFDYDEGRTIPFTVANDADRPTIDSILHSLNAYARHHRMGDSNLSSAIAFQYRSVSATDGRIKKMKVIRARRDLVQLQ